VPDASPVAPLTPSTAGFVFTRFVMEKALVAIAHGSAAYARTGKGSERGHPRRRGGEPGTGRRQLVEAGEVLHDRATARS
jgi:hypothetical protein